MKNFIIFFLTLTIFSAFAQASSINAAAYRTMQMQSQRNSYRRANPNYTPYWKIQSDYRTRNRVYKNYSHYDNTMQRYSNPAGTVRRF